MRLLSMTAVVCALAFAGFASQATRTTTVIVGRVVDSAGGPVSGAVVRLTAATFNQSSSVTDIKGEFRFVDVRPAAYEIEVSHPAFVTLTRALIVKFDRAGRFAIELSLQSLPLSPGAPPPAPSSPTDKRPTAHESLFRSGPAAKSLPVTERARVDGAPVFEDFRRYAPAPFNTEAYDRIEDNAFRSTRVDPLSTFSIDVDTASYANVRRFLNSGTLPPADAVRIEEMINYFRYEYPAPASHAPFSMTTELAAAPWNPKHRLALIGLQARRLDEDRALRRNLVFLIDVSGSMMPDDKLPLIRKALRMLVDTLTATDRIAIVVYAGQSGVVLPATPGHQKDRIHRVIAGLEAGGSTNGGAGITLAYRIAAEHFISGGVNRVILATDGDFNVGITNQGDLIRLIEEQRRAGVFLSVLGVGTGNLKDSTMEKLAGRGNGNYSYLDSVHEARKVLLAEAGGTLVTVAKDVKIQVEFNPAHVAAYRLIGYENRVLKNEDFNDDRRDAGEIGAGHTVTALYEIVPPGVALETPGIDPLRYQHAPRPPAVQSSDMSSEIFTVKVRYKEPDGEKSRLLAFPVSNRTTPLSDNIGFAAAIAEFGMVLRRSEHKSAASYRDAAALARRHRGSDESGYRAEFIRLVEIAEAISRRMSGDVGEPRVR